MGAYKNDRYKDSYTEPNNFQNGYNYSYGTEAYDYDIITPYKTVKRKRKRKRKELKAGATKDEFILGLTIVFCACLVFINAFSYVGKYSTLAYKQIELRKLKLESIELQSSINKCNAIISEKLDIDKIIPKAKELGYRDPLPHQIVYIELEEKSYTGYTD